MAGATFWTNPQDFIRLLDDGHHRRIHLPDFPGHALATTFCNTRRASLDPAHKGNFRPFMETPGEAVLDRLQWQIAELRASRGRCAVLSGICPKPATGFVRACAGLCHAHAASVRRAD